VNLNVDENGQPKADPLVKRICGLPGEQLVMQDGVLYSRTKDSDEFKSVAEDAKFACWNLNSLPSQLKRKIQMIPLAQKQYDCLLEVEEARRNLDINSVIDQWLVLELAMNREYGDPRSVYMFMDGDVKLSGGPVWDFDRGTFQNPDKAGNLCSYVLGGSTDTKYRIKSYNEWLCWRTAENEKFSYVWYKKLITDPIFQETVKKRWEVMKPYLITVASRILEYGQSLALSYKYDSAKTRS
jgi:hypothetical protein